jgi:hypothetical protein
MAKLKGTEELLFVNCGVAVEKDRYSGMGLTKCARGFRRQPGQSAFFNGPLQGSRRREVDLFQEIFQEIRFFENFRGNVAT